MPPGTKVALRIGVVLVCCLPFAPGSARAMPPIEVPMIAAQWHAKDARTKIDFIRREGFPQGLMKVTSGTAILDGVTMQNGTVAFDAELTGEGMPGIRFREPDDDTAELVYLRPGPDCPASQDCIQYAPVTHGAMLWDEFPQYQRPAPVVPKGWNHFKLVISGRRMNVFVNRSSAPDLAVGRLEGDVLRGGLRLVGPATFANLVITPGATEGLRPGPLEDPADRDPNIARDWQVSGVSMLAPGVSPSFDTMPNAAATWRMLRAERGGLVNLNRIYGTPDPGSLRCVAWLKTTLVSSRDGTRRVSMGWLREAWVFVNGRMVFSGRNFWDPPGPKRTPDGRLSLDNASFDLPLRKGPNQIVIALNNEDSDSSTHFGWGLKLRLADIDGLQIAR